MKSSALRFARVPDAAPRREWWRPVEKAPARAAATPGAAVAPLETLGSVIAFRALVAFTFILILAPQQSVAALRPWRIALLAALIGIVAQVVDCVLRGHPPMVWGREMTLATGLVAWAILTLPLSYWPGGSVTLLTGFYLKTLAIFWLLVNTVDRLSRLRTLAWALTLMAVPLALTGVKQFLSGTFLGGGQVVDRIVGYEAGLTGNPNDLAFMLNLILPVALALLPMAKGRLSRAVLVGIAVLIAAAVVVTFSRAGFLTLAAVAVLHLWRLARRGAPGWALAAAVAVLAGSVLLPSGYLERLGTIFDIDTDITGSAQERWRDTAAAVRFVAANPVIGAGLGMNTLALNETRGSTWLKVHNVYLEYAVDLGLPGLALFLTLFFSSLRRVRSIRKAAASPDELVHLAEGIEIALLAFAVGGFFSPVAYHFHSYYLAGLAVAAGTIHRAAQG